MIFIHFVLLSFLIYADSFFLTKQSFILDQMPRKIELTSFIEKSFNRNIRVNIIHFTKLFQKIIKSVQLTNKKYL